MNKLANTNKLSQRVTFGVSAFQKCEVNEPNTKEHASNMGILPKNDYNDDSSSIQDQMIVSSEIKFRRACAQKEKPCTNPTLSELLMESTMEAPKQFTAKKSCMHESQRTNKGIIQKKFLPPKNRASKNRIQQVTFGVADFQKYEVNEPHTKEHVSKMGKLLLNDCIDDSSSTQQDQMIVSPEIKFRRVCTPKKKPCTNPTLSKLFMESMTETPKQFEHFAEKKLYRPTNKGTLQQKFLKPKNHSCGLEEINGHSEYADFNKYPYKPKFSIISTTKPATLWKEIKQALTNLRVDFIETSPRDCSLKHKKIEAIHHPQNSRDGLCHFKVEWFKNSGPNEVLVVFQQLNKSWSFYDLFYELQILLESNIKYPRKIRKSIPKMRPSKIVLGIDTLHQVVNMANSEYIDVSRRGFRTLARFSECKDNQALLLQLYNHKLSSLIRKVLATLGSDYVQQHYVLTIIANLSAHHDFSIQHHFRHHLSQLSCLLFQILLSSSQSTLHELYLMDTRRKVVVVLINLCKTHASKLIEHASDIEKAKGYCGGSNILYEDRLHTLQKMVFLDQICR